VAPSLEEMDAVLSSYEFIEKLGQGGMGAVYKVRQYSLDRMAAIKVMPRFEDADGMGFAERFQREAQAMGKLSHPNIVSVYDFGQTSDGMLYIVMEYVEGADLQKLLRGGELTVDHLFGWIPQICSALEYAHQQGIVHRDIKPGNILINNEGMVKVADFGLAKLAGNDAQTTRLTQTNMAMGTPDYLAPEALELGVELDHRADIYAIGVMLYEMLTGKIPRGAWRPPSKVNPHIDARFDEIVTRAMDSQREERFQSASELSGQLSTLWTTTDDAVRIVTESDPEDSKSKGSRASKRSTRVSASSQRSGGAKKKVASGGNSALWIGIAASVLVIFGVAAFFLLQSGSSEGEQEQESQALALVDEPGVSGAGSNYSGP